jgi:hypothetical protein
VGFRSYVGSHSYFFNRSRHDGDTFSANKVRNNKHVQRSSRIYY